MLDGNDPAAEFDSKSKAAESKSICPILGREVSYLGLVFIYPFIFLLAWPLFYPTILLF